MTPGDELEQYRPAPVPEDYLEEQRANHRWLAALQAAVSRGLKDDEAVTEANAIAPEALRPSRYLFGFPAQDPPPVPPRATRREGDGIEDADLDRDASEDPPRRPRPRFVQARDEWWMERCVGTRSDMLERNSYFPPVATLSSGTRPSLARP